MSIFITGIKVSEKYPYISLHDSQACVYAGTSYSMSSGRPAIVLCKGIEESLRACAGSLTPWGDKVALFILCAVKDSEIDIIKNSFHAVSRRIFICPEISHIYTIPEYFSPSEFPVTFIISEKIPFDMIIEKLLSCEIKEDNLPSCREFSEVIREIERAEKPVILVGRGCINSIENAIELGERIKSPLLLTAGATTAPAEKMISLSRKNHLIIPSGNPVWLSAFVSADLILALGTAFSEVDWFGLKNLKIHRGKLLNISNQILPEGLADVSFKTNLSHFFAKVSGIKECKKRKFYDSLVRRSKKYREVLKEEVEKLKEMKPLHPSLVAYEIVEKSPDETIFVSEGGACGMWLWMHLWLKPFVFPVQNGTIGVSIPMALGVKSAFPQKNVWAVMGDGAFFYNLYELNSINNYKLPVVIFIFNDASWGAIRLAQTFIYSEDYTGTDIADIDYAELAGIYGFDGITVRNYDDLTGAIEFAKRTEKPLVVDVKIKRDCVPVAGGNFVVAEFDGSLKWLIPGMLRSSIKNIKHKKLPLEALRIIKKSIL